MSLIFRTIPVAKDKNTTSTVTLQFQLDPYNGNYVFIFCNRKRDAIKVLRYNQDGFVLATKKLLDDLKFQWPRTPNEVKEISFQQVEWLLQGLEIEQKKAHQNIQAVGKKEIQTKKVIFKRQLFQYHHCHILSVHHP